MGLLTSDPPVKKRRATKVIPPRKSCTLMNGLARHVTMDEVAGNYDAATTEIAGTEFDLGMVWVMVNVNNDRFKHKLGGCLHYQKTDLKKGLPKSIRRAKVCALLMVSHSDQYEGGEFDGKKIGRGVMVFFDPSVEIPAINPVTSGECKAYFISAYRMYGIGGMTPEEKVAFFRNEAGMTDDEPFVMGTAVNDKEVL